MFNITLLRLMAKFKAKLSLNTTKIPKPTNFKKIHIFLFYLFFCFFFFLYICFEIYAKETL